MATHSNQKVIKGYRKNITKLFSVFVTISQAHAQDIPHDPEALAFCHSACQVVQNTVVSVYKDTFYWDNLGEI